MTFVVIILLAMMISAYFIANFIVFNRKRSIADAMVEYGHNYDLSEYETSPFSIQNKRKEMLYGDFYYVENPKGIIIICHGFACNRVFSFNYAKMFLSLGYNVLIYDHTHSGESEGTKCGMGFYESEDLEEIVQYIKDNYNYSLIGTLGESMGAATVLKHLGKYNSVDFTIADCPYESLRKQIKSRINKLIKLPGFVLLPIIDTYLHLLGGYGFRDVNIKESVINIKKPFMLVHGSTDSYISVEDSLNLKLANDNCKKIYICNGADHARSYEQDPEKYKEEVNDFLNSINLK
ncbi:MAG: alpha/beta hydrolase [Eubacteriales bacterium]|nr:alpha/beta hydrolase [Eubacteriales bacterium]